nr:autotransporter-associated beta strand repeat-containing protein [Salmonella enterica]
MLTLSGANSYSGGTLISDGTLVASNVEALGTGDVTDDAVLELNTGGDFDNAISGSGQVVKSGDETLTLSGSNTLWKNPAMTSSRFPAAILIPAAPLSAAARWSPTM